jgi:hypothetical protein
MIDLARLWRRPARQTRESQPESGMRFTSQTGQHHHETLGQFSPDPTHPYNSAVHSRIARGFRNPVNYRLRMILAAGQLTDPISQAPR